MLQSAEVRNNPKSQTHNPKPETVFSRGCCMNRVKILSPRPQTPNPEPGVFSMGCCTKGGGGSFKIGCCGAPLWGGEARGGAANWR